MGLQASFTISGNTLPFRTVFTISELSELSNTLRDLSTRDSIQQFSTCRDEARKKEKIQYNKIDGKCFPIIVQNYKNLIIALTINDQLQLPLSVSEKRLERRLRSCCSLVSIIQLFSVSSTSKSPLSTWRWKEKDRERFTVVHVYLRSYCNCFSRLDLNRTYLFVLKFGWGNDHTP